MKYRDKYIGGRKIERSDTFENELEIDLLGEALRQIRKGKQLTQEQLDGLVRLQKELISKIENSDSEKNVPIEILQKVFEALKVKVNLERRAE